MFYAAATHAHQPLVLHKFYTQADRAKAIAAVAEAAIPGNTLFPIKQKTAKHLGGVFCSSASGRAWSCVYFWCTQTNQTRAALFESWLANGDVAGAEGALNAMVEGLGDAVESRAAGWHQ